MAAYDRFYTGDIAKEFVRGSNEQGGLVTLKDLANWKPKIEAPLHVNYKGIEVYKLQQWTQGPMLLQGLNILENIDLKSMGYNSPQYIHTVFQALSMSFADRDFYYGDPAFSPNIPMQGLLSKAYAKDRAKQILLDKNDPNIAPGDPYPYEGKTNPYLSLLQKRKLLTDTNAIQGSAIPKHDQTSSISIEDLKNSIASSDEAYHDRLWRGTTSVEAADTSGWVVSITPSGGWLPACVAGKTGIGMSQRMQSFVLDSTIDPFNVVAPGKRPRVTLTPSLALKDGKPLISFGVQGGDTQDQNLLQFFLNMVEFNMTVQEATEAPNFNTNQLWLSLGGTKMKDRKPRAGNILLSNTTKPAVSDALKKMGYNINFGNRTSGPINAIYLDQKHNTIWGGSSNNGEDYGIGW
jgi:gamma-glutamyltranspeptidase/glutathione hydrolase